jgi:hypothetical protein
MNGEKRSKHVVFVAINVPIFNKEKGEEFCRRYSRIKKSKRSVVGISFHTLKQTNTKKLH